MLIQSIFLVVTTLCRDHKYTEKNVFDTKIDSSHATVELNEPIHVLTMHKKVKICMTECILIKGFKFKQSLSLSRAHTLSL